MKTRCFSAPSRAGLQIFRLAALSLWVILVAAGCGGDSNPVEPGNKPPHIQGIVAFPPAVSRAGQTQITVLASDPDDDVLHYRWSAPAGVFTDSSEATIRWRAPDAPGVFRIQVVVSDGALAESTSINVSVGSGTLFVTSDPPGFDILLNDQPTGHTTPDSLTRLPISTYTVSLGGSELRFAPSDTTITISEGQVATMTFRIPPVATELVDTGDPVDEIGGLAYTKLGFGILYAARSGLEATLRSASLVPTHTGQNGSILVNDMSLLESISVRSAGPATPEVAFVKADQILIGRLIDANNDGLVEQVENPGPLRNVLTETFGPAFNLNGTILAYALNPSTAPNENELVLAGRYDSSYVYRTILVTRSGNALSFGPEPLAVYESAGELFKLDVDTLHASSGIQVTHTGGNARSPAVSPDGRFVAYIDARGALKLLVLDIEKTVTLLDTVTTSRVAWAPNGRELIIADNSIPGNARLRLVYNLPIQ